MKSKFTEMLHRKLSTTLEKTRLYSLNNTSTNLYYLYIYHDLFYTLNLAFSWRKIYQQSTQQTKSNLQN